MFQNSELLSQISHDRISQAQAETVQRQQLRGRKTNAAARPRGWVAALALRWTAAIHTPATVR